MSSMNYYDEASGQWKKVGITVPAVTHVNGKSGDVVLTADDVKARPDSWMPTAADVGAAPVGFGLGGMGEILTAKDDLNKLIKTGVYGYQVPDAPQNAPPVIKSGVVTISTNGWNGTIQTVTSVYTGDDFGLKIQRVIRQSIVGEWEWINPPMMPGIEYRTTERYMGKPVYKLALEIPEGYTSPLTTINLGAYNIDRMAAVPAAYARAGMAPAINQDDFLNAYSVYFAAITPNVITIRCGKRVAGAGPLSVCLSYTKF